MAYEKQTWTTGEVITQEKLNHMEDGIANAGGGGVLTIVNTIVQNNGGVYTVQFVDKTFAEIAAAIENGEYVVARVRIDTSGAPYSNLAFLQPPNQANFPTDGSSESMRFEAALFDGYYNNAIHWGINKLTIPRTGTPTFERTFVNNATNS